MRTFPTITRAEGSCRSLTGRLGVLLLSAGAHAGLVGVVGAWLLTGPAALSPLYVDVATLDAEPPPSPPPAPRPAARKEITAPGRAAVPRAAAAPPATPPPELPPQTERPAPPAVQEPATVAAPPSARAPDPVSPAAPAQSGGSTAPTAPPPAPPGTGAPRGGPAEGAGGSPSAVLSAMATRSPGSAVGAEYGPYLTTFRKTVQTMLQYPMGARRRGLSGKVELEVSIDPSGKVAGVEVVASSSHEMLDGAAVQAIRAVPPVPFPPGLPPRALRVRLPLVFELR